MAHGRCRGDLFSVYFQMQVPIWTNLFTVACVFCLTFYSEFEFYFIFFSTIDEATPRISILSRIKIKRKNKKMLAESKTRTGKTKAIDVFEDLFLFLSLSFSHSKTFFVTIFQFWLSTFNFFHTLTRNKQKFCRSCQNNFNIFVGTF